MQKRLNTEPWLTSILAAHFMLEIESITCKNQNCLLVSAFLDGEGQSQ